jgi:homocysteine S-methyltransferase
MMYYPHRIPLVLEAALATGLPVWVGFAVRRDEQGKIVSFARERSIPLADMVSVLDRVHVQAAGFMHSPADVVSDAISVLKQRYAGPMMAYPDSGYFRMPNWQFEDVIEPEVLVEFARDWVNGGVQVLGGCCGLSPRHIAALHEFLLER